MVFKDLPQCQTGVENSAISIKKTQQLVIFSQDSAVCCTCKVSQEYM